MLKDFQKALSLLILLIYITARMFVMVYIADTILNYYVNYFKLGSFVGTLIWSVIFISFCYLASKLEDRLFYRIERRKAKAF